MRASQGGRAGRHTRRCVQPPSLALPAGALLQPPCSILLPTCGRAADPPLPHCPARQVLALPLHLLLEKLHKRALLGQQLIELLLPPLAGGQGPAGRGGQGGLGSAPDTDSDGSDAEAYFTPRTSGSDAASSSGGGAGRRGSEGAAPAHLPPAEQLVQLQQVAEGLAFSSFEGALQRCTAVSAAPSGLLLRSAAAVPQGCHALRVQLEGPTCTCCGLPAFHSHAPRSATAACHSATRSWARRRCSRRSRWWGRLATWPAWHSAC